jgi:hypothetical protein
MVLRTFFAIDNDNLVVTSSSNAGIVGNGIINNSDTPNGTIFIYSGGGGTSVTIDDTNTFADNIPFDNNLFFNDDDRFNHTVTNGGGIVGNGSLVDAESTIILRALDSAGNPTGPEIEVTVFSQNNTTGNVWGFGTDTPLVDGVSYIKVGGDNDGTVRYTDFITCFEARTKIKVRSGLKAAEDIAIGDMVWTRDSGYQPVRWVGKTTVAARGAFAPVVIKPGGIGNAEELVVSQQHRILLSSASAELLFGVNEVFVAAKHLCGLPGVSERAGGSITYVHFMFDTHQIVSANGISCESFFLSEFSVSGVEADQRRELLALFPSLKTGMQQFGSTAVTTLKGFEANLFCDYLQAGHSGR